MGAGVGTGVGEGGGTAVADSEDASMAELELSRQTATPPWSAAAATRVSSCSVVAETSSVDDVQLTPSSEYA